MPAQLLSTSEGQTLVLTLSNPGLRNAMEPSMGAAASKRSTWPSAAPDVRSVVITGAGGMFCSGGNLQRLQANRQQPPKCKPRALKACTNGLRPSAPTPSPSSRRWKALRLAQAFRWHRPATWWWRRAMQYFDGLQQRALSPDGGASWSPAHTLPRPLATELLMWATRSPPSGCMHWAWSTA